MTKEESDLIIFEQNKSREEILKAIAKVKADYHELCNLKDMRIANLEKENAELQETVIKMNNVITKTFGNLTKAKELIDSLSKSLFVAKGIVRDLIDDTVDFKESKERATYCYEQKKFDTYKEAEQFLSEVEK